MENVKKIVRLSGEQKKSLLLFFSFSFILSSAITLLTILLPKIVLDYFSFYPELTNIIKLLVLICGTTFIFKCIQFYCKKKMESISTALFHEAYRKIAMKFMKLPFQETVRKENLDLLEAGKYGIWEISAIFDNLEQIGAAIICIILEAIILIYYDWKIILLPIIVNLLFGFVYKKINQIDADNAKRLIPENRAFGWYCRLMTDFTYGRDIRLYRAKSFIMQKCSETMEKIYLANQRAFSKKGFWLGSSKFFVQMQIVLAMVALQKMYMSDFAVSDYLLIFGSINGVSNAMNQILEYSGRVKKMNLLMAPFFEFMELPEEEGRNAEKENTDELTIKFENVSFSYPNCKEKAIDEINIEIKQGQKIGIVGTNGAGKSTLVKLMCGFYLPTSGKILINGEEITQKNATAYRGMISTVFQDFMLLPVTLEENISSKYNHDLTEKEKKRVKKLIFESELREWVEKLPDLEETYIAPGQAHKYILPSGGQSQNIAVARSLFKDAEINILDEPTIALDVYEEMAVMQRFYQMSKDKVTILISHRLSHIKFVDKIIVMDQGKIVEEGTHNELVNKNGLYAEMYRTQAQKYNLM